MYVSVLLGFNGVIYCLFVLESSTLLRDVRLHEVEHIAEFFRRTGVGQVEVSLECYVVANSISHSVGCPLASRDRNHTVLVTVTHENGSVLVCLMNKGSKGGDVREVTTEHNKTRKLVRVL